ncbi:MAG: acetate kinase [Proteobacteria bacterium]|nr:MAG: acetate kinase [Pseudomonadota bacterium]
MAAAILVLNAGSSSLKGSLFAADDGALALLAHGEIASLARAPRFTSEDGAGRRVAERHWTESESLTHDAALDHWMGLAAVGHRVVHGGTAFAQPVRVDADVLARLEALEPLAPLHQPHNLAPIRRLLAESPDLPQVACFDTAFHRTNPRTATLFALPLAWEAAGVRRYGFHGLSYESIAAQLPQVDARAAAGRTIVLHLGNGVSLCALRAGASVATTMGFSTLDGVPMSTRSGALDPGALLYLLRQPGMDVARLETLLYEESGLLGVSGVASDMRTLLASDALDARLAVELFVARIGREIGSLAAALGGLDALVFTAGIGENAPAIRARVCAGAAWLGVALDDAANAAGGPRLHRDASRVAVWVLATGEEKQIAEHVRALVAL